MYSGMVYNAAQTVSEYHFCALVYSWLNGVGAGACKMAAEQPFLQNESSGLPPACKPKLQQAGVYYLVIAQPVTLLNNGYPLT